MPDLSAAKKLLFKPFFSRKYSLDSVTFAIKTFKRPKALKTLIKSIRTRYPKQRIVIADDGTEGEFNETHIWVSEIDNVEHYQMEFDSGLSAGRNLLLEKVATSLVMLLDDDTVFTDDTRLEYALNILNRYHHIDLVAGKYEPDIFYGSMVIENNQLIRDFQICSRIFNNTPLFDFTPNFFLAKVDKCLDVRWDPELKIQEHMDFFWRARGKINSTYLPYFKAVNSHAREDSDYEKYRGRIEKYQSLQAKKIGVESITHRFNEPNYLNAEVDKIFLQPESR